jgi:hypothetical protein
MRASTNRTRLLLAALAAAIPMLAATTAEAQFRRGVKPYYWWNYETRRPERGYEGWVAPGYYCSYKRYPNRKCSTNASGRKRCRIVSWRLEQTCQ